jgi:hypothetical protein
MKTATKTAKTPQEKQKSVRYPQFEDKLQAQKERDRLFEYAKELLSQILMVTTGCSTVNGTSEEWGHANLIELLEIFQIRHENFERGQFAEDLQSFLFTWTHKHDDTYREWKEEIVSKSEVASVIAADYSEFEKITE